MKKIFSGFISKKLIFSLLTMALLLSGLCFLSSEGSEALASDSSTSTFKVEQLEIGNYTEKDENNNIVRTAPKPDTTSDYKDWIFAGWYTNEACTGTVSKTTETGTYYAKFVPSEVLSAKCQVSADTTSATSTSTSKLRIVSTVDSLKYSQVGFDLVFKGKTIPYSTNKVYSKIEAAADGVKYGFSPNIFDLQSEYFITATLINIKSEDFDEGILIKPYWVTKDGTKVYGVSRYARVEDSYLGIVNVPVRLYSDAEATSGTATVTYDASKFEYQDTYNSILNSGEIATNGYDNGYVFENIDTLTNTVNDTSGIGSIEITATSSEAVTTDGMLVNLRLKTKDNVTLPKINTFTVTANMQDANATAVATVAPNVIYMNFKTGAYSGVADTSWIDKSQEVFVITTAEEFYGFAEYSKEYVFPGKTIYLGADITINNSATDSTYPWPQIGTSTLAFAGTFDGQGHTINGIYENDTVAAGYVGLFAHVSGTIKNFSLENSTFSSTGNMVGSIAGYLTGNISGVSSSATVVNNATATDDCETGGLVGRFGGTSTAAISNCMFSGTVTSSSRDLGGIAGRVARGSKTIEHCLNAGTVKSNLTGTGVWAGGIIGGVEPQVINGANVDITLVLQDSLNTGIVDAAHFVGVGSVIGFVSDSDTNDITFANTYATNQVNSNDSAMGATGIGSTTTYIEGSVGLHDEDSIKGYTGYTNTDLALSFYTNSNKSEGGYWVTRAEDIPMLKTFADDWVDYGWYSASADVKEFEISTAQELYGFSELSQSNAFAGKTIKLCKDITVNEGTASNWGSVVPKRAWIPIGTSTAFVGTFDGQGHTISGIYVNDTAASTFAGLFAQAGGTIKNFYLKNSYIASNGAMTGSIAGFATGSIENVYSNAVVESTATLNTAKEYECGGMVGRFGSGSTAAISNCWFDGTVSSNNRNLGGIVGRMAMGTKTLKYCLVTNTVKSNVSGTGVWAGGLIGGVAPQTTVNVTVQESLNAATVNAAHFVGVGAVAGYVASSNVTMTMKHTYATNQKLSNASAMAVVGTGTATGGTLLDETAIVGDGAFQMTGLDFAAYWTAKEDTTPELTTLTSETGSLTTPGNQPYTGWYDGVAGTYVITTAAELHGLSELSNTLNFNGSTIKLGADITLNKGTLDPKGEEADWNATIADWTEWTPIGIGTWFNGTFDGQGYTIRGVYVTDALAYNAESRAGLFAKTLSSAKIQNLRLEDSYIQGGGYYVGAITAQSNGTQYAQVYSNAIVKGGSWFTGGLVGAVQSGGGTFANCWYDGTIKLADAGGQAGGIVGVVRNDTCTVTMDTCLNTANIDSKRSGGNHWVGGLVGALRLGTPSITITNSLNAGMITVAGNTAGGVGSILGHVDAGTAEIKATYGAEGWNAVGTGTATTENVQLLPTKQLTGAQARYSIPFGFYGEDEATDNWVTRKGKYPGIKCLVPESEWYTGDEAIIADTSWYVPDKTNGSTFIIDTAAKLYGLAEKSKSDSYFYATVKLGADITVNIGDAAKWGITPAVNEWTQIGTTSITFGGTFDGQGYTIKGIYLNTDAQYGGLFTQTNGSLSNFKLTNSYFQSSNTQLGSVIGSLNGNMSNVYSDAMVVTSSKQCGGLAGQFNSAKTISGCWFDGTVISTCTDAQQGIGGLVGLVDKAGNKIENCLNTGDITVTSGRTGQLLGVGGLVGMSINAADKMIKLEITDCMNAGVITVDHPRGTGSVIGVLDNTTTYTNTLVLTNVYTTNQYVETSSLYDWTEDVCTGIGLNLNDTATITGSVIEASVDDRLIGYVAYDATEKLDFEATWVLRKNGVPALKNFVPESEQYKAVDTDLALATLGTDITLRGNGVDAGDGSYVVSVTDIDGTIYTNYLAALEGNGFTEYANNDAGLATQGVKNVVYEKAEDGFNWVVSVTHAGNEKQKTYVAVSTSEVLSSHLQGAVTYTKDDAYTTEGIAPTLTMMQLTSTSGAGNSFVIQLSNGHFIIHDGGFEDDLEGLVAYLKSLCGGKKPIIEAWVISHAHSDHWGPLERIYTDSRDGAYNWADEIYVEGIYYNESAAYVKGNFEPVESSSTSELIYDILDEKFNEKVKRGMALLKTTGGSVPEVYRYRTGQRFTFADVTMDVVQMEEQILDCLADDGLYNDGSNGTSASVMFTINGKRVYMGGDEYLDNMNFTMSAYNDTYFNNLDVYVAPHHGSNTWIEFAAWCTNSGSAKFGKVLFPHLNAYPPYWNDEAPYSNYKLISQYTTDTSVYTYANGNVVLTFGETISVSK